VCKQLGDEGIIIIDVKWIESVAAMIPFSRPDQEAGGLLSKEFYLVEKISLGYSQPPVLQNSDYEDN